MSRTVQSPLEALSLMMAQRTAPLLCQRLVKVEYGVRSHGAPPVRITSSQWDWIITGDTPTPKSLANMTQGTGARR